jgi:hypothetical protein
MSAPVRNEQSPQQQPRRPFTPTSPTQPPSSPGRALSPGYPYAYLNNGSPSNNYYSNNNNGYSPGQGYWSSGYPAQCPPGPPGYNYYHQYPNYNNYNNGSYPPPPPPPGQVSPQCHNQPGYNSNQQFAQRGYHQKRPHYQV